MMREGERVGLVRGGGRLLCLLLDLLHFCLRLWG